MWKRAGSVQMLVHIDFASAVNRSALGGRLRLERIDFRAIESLKSEGWECAIGWSFRSTHLPSPCRRLLRSKHTGRVG